ncbi:MAG: asparaginase [Eubacterium sp.]
MKISVVYTGGTIGSVKANGVVSVSNSVKGELIKRYNSNFKGDICFREMSPFTILSENLSAETLNKLIQTIKAQVESDYDGVIITHGTDTVQYSACALSLALGDCIPVMLVSSNYPLEDARANGYENFAGAVEFIKAKAGRGVFVPYKNSNEDLKFHRGDRVMLHNSYTDSLESLLNMPYAEYRDGKIKLLHPQNNPVPTAKMLDLSENSGILSIFAHPADSFSYSLDGVSAVIISAYHSGTLNTADTGFKSFCKRAVDRNIPVYVFNVPYGNTYESESEFEALGLVRLPVCTYPFAYINIWQNPYAFTDVEF